MSHHAGVAPLVAKYSALMELFAGAAPSHVHRINLERHRSLRGPGSLAGRKTKHLAKCCRAIVVVYN